MGNIDKTTLVEKFVKALDLGGDAFFATGSLDDDLEMITGVIKAQGFWSGVGFRYYFDEDFNLIKMEERRFGNV